MSSSFGDCVRNSLQSLSAEDGLTRFGRSDGCRPRRSHFWRLSLRPAHPRNRAARPRRRLALRCGSGRNGQSGAAGCCRVFEGVPKSELGRMKYERGAGEAPAGGTGGVPRNLLLNPPKSGGQRGLTVVLRQPPPGGVLMRSVHPRGTATCASAPFLRYPLAQPAGRML
jgi:hypothetical protein